MEFCLISSNIRFDNPADGENSWVHRRDILASTLLKHRPDVIATQEGRFNQLKNFESIMVDYQIIDQHRSWIRERMYPSFYLRTGKFEILRSDDLWLSETPEVAGSISFGSSFPRLMTWMKIQPKNTEHNLFIVNTHLDHVRPQTRIEQTKVLIQEIQSRRDQRYRLIIMGDFNEGPTGEVRKLINKAFPELIDSWKICNNHEETSHHAFNGECQNGSRIDWILVDQALKVEDCFLEKTVISGRYPSDHFPVICRLRL
jgi:endonuclease/exonuclease/phosphatase family metal-dependent hydrolase